MKILGYNILSDKALNESTKSKDKVNQDLHIDAPYNDYGAADLFNTSQYHIWDLISRLRNIQGSAKERYQEYSYMNSDSIIQTALELYSDDSTQVDSRTDKIVSIKSNDKTLESDLNEFLSFIDVNRHIWNWTYNVCQYGDWFLRIKVDPDTKELRIDDSTDPSLLMDLYENGKRLGFAEEDESEYKSMKRKSNPNSLDLIMHSPDSFVHFMIHKSSKYDKLELPIPEQTDAHGDQLVRKVIVVRGTSMIEAVRPIYRILELLEDTLLAARIAKSEYVRVFNIEVGNSTPSMTTQIINRVKSMFDSKASFDTNTGRYQSVKSYRPVGDPVFNPIRNGKGSITHEVIGGDIEVQNIADIDYFKTKLFGGLKIPAAYFGFTESLPGGLGDNTLTRLDIRYSHSVKRVQNALIEGIKDLCGIWLKYNNRNYNPDDFQVLIKDSSDIERLASLTEFDMKMTTINNTISNLSNTFQENAPDLAKIYKVLVDKFIDDIDILNVLDEEFDKLIAKKKSPSNPTDNSMSNSSGPSDNPYEAHPDMDTKTSDDTGSDNYSSLSANSDIL
jgi:hypothetical protein